MKKTWVVRLAFPFDGMKGTFGDMLRLNPDFGAFFECLRYAGLVDVNETQTNLLVDLLPPSGVDSHTWATQNAERISTFGFNAAAAPRI